MGGVILGKYSHFRPHQDPKIIEVWLRYLLASYAIWDACGSEG